MCEFIMAFFIVVQSFGFIHHGMSRRPKGCVLYNAMLGMYMVIFTVQMHKYLDRIICDRHYHYEGCYLVL
jgi:hypothetical protein